MLGAGMARSPLSSGSRLAVALLALSRCAQAVPYTLTEDYSGSNFFNHFDFVTSDPSGGWVTYVDQADAQALQYVSASNTSAIMRVDSTSVLDPNGAGRRAVRIESKQSFTHGLIIGDFTHMPVGCGSWPAFWMYGPNWPNSGEIDIIEGVNNQKVNQISGHTSDDCTIAGSGTKSTFVQSDCYQPYTNSGCYFQANTTNTYGAGFNRINGGVYAMQWESQYISVWFFPRGKIPPTIKAQKPDPSKWGKPLAQFAGSGCDIDGHFQQMKIVLNTDFCGPWAGSVFSQQGCGSSCVDYVASNPSAFQSAIWNISSIRVYSAGDSTTFNPDGVSSGGNEPAPANSVLSFSSATPLASISSVSQPGAAMGGTSTPEIGPTPNPTVKPSVVTSLTANPKTTKTTKKSSSKKPTTTKAHTAATESPIQSTKTQTHSEVTESPVHSTKTKHRKHTTSTASKKHTATTSSSTKSAIF